MGDFYHTDHVHGFTPNSEYECYDRDVTDHVGKCADGADTPADTDCAAKFIAADSFEADGCPTAAPDNCAWAAAPAAPNPKPPHPTAASFDGYSHLSGACRSTPVDRLFDDSPKMSGRPAYIYRKRSRCEAWPSEKGEASSGQPAASSGMRSSHPDAPSHLTFCAHAGTPSSPPFPTGPTPRR